MTTENMTKNLIPGRDIPRVGVTCQTLGPASPFARLTVFRDGRDPVSVLYDSPVAFRLYDRFVARHDMSEGRPIAKGGGVTFFAC